MLHVTEAGHAKLCVVVGCFRGEKPPLREVGPPEQPQRDLRRPSAQPTSSAGSKQRTRPSQTQFFIPPCLPNHTSINQVTTSLRRLIAVSPSLIPARGVGSAPAQPRYPKSDTLLAGASQNNLPVAAALRAGRLPSLASSVANGCFWFLDFCALLLVERYMRKGGLVRTCSRPCAFEAKKTKKKNKKKSRRTQNTPRNKSTAALRPRPPRDGVR